jgi:hypothetical protein
MGGKEFDKGYREAQQRSMAACWKLSRWGMPGPVTIRESGEGYRRKVQLTNAGVNLKSAGKSNGNVMPNAPTKTLLETLRDRFGALTPLPGSHSLFAIGADAARVYFRYSKVHPGGRTFFGIREIDLKQLEGHNSFLCFLLDDGSAPSFIPYSDFEEVFRSAETANDGQYKVQIVSREAGRQLYIARKGRFSIDGYAGLESLESSITGAKLREARDLSHAQVQTLLGCVGQLKGFDVWVPDNNVNTLDWSMGNRFPVVKGLPAGFGDVSSILGEVDVVWLTRGGNNIEGLFEVEHSTPVYSGLLRFNDLLLTSPRLTQFHIVSNEIRRETFSRQAFRPTFRKSGLSELVSFLEYGNGFDWHKRLLKGSGLNAK